jgi:hypothetical protein
VATLEDLNGRHCLEHVQGFWFCRFGGKFSCVGMSHPSLFILCTQLCTATAVAVCACRRPIGPDESDWYSQALEWVCTGKPIELQQLRACQHFSCASGCCLLRLGGWMLPLSITCRVLLAAAARLYGRTFLCVVGSARRGLPATCFKAAPCTLPLALVFAFASGATHFAAFCGQSSIVCLGSCCLLGDVPQLCSLIAVDPILVESTCARWC